MDFISKKIPREKFQVFHDILCECGGGYIGDTTVRAKTVIVSYYLDAEGHKKFNTLWKRHTTEIVEVRKDQWWRYWLRRIGVKV